MDKWLNIQLSKCLVVLSEKELSNLLTRDPELWKTALKRGKAFTRSRQTRQRVASKVETEKHST